MARGPGYFTAAIVIVLVVAFIILVFYFPVHYEDSIKLGAKVLNCSIPTGQAKVQLDYHMQNEGASDGDTLIMNPKFLNQWPPVVRWFVFEHECGHLQYENGGTELQADDYAVRAGIKQGWLKVEDLQSICDAWEDEPETSDHPSAQRRCDNLSDRWDEYAATEKPITPKPVLIHRRE